MSTNKIQSFETWNDFKSDPKAKLSNKIKCLTLKLSKIIANLVKKSEVISRIYKKKKFSKEKFLRKSRKMNLTTLLGCRWNTAMQTRTLYTISFHLQWPPNSNSKVMTIQNSAILFKSINQSTLWLWLVLKLKLISTLL